MAIFDDILAKVPEGEREFFTKYPDIKASLDRLDTVQTELADAAKERDTWKEFGQGFAAWRKEHWDEAKNMTKEQIATQAALEEAQNRVKALELVGETDMTMEEVLANLKAQGYVPKADLEAAVETRFKTVAEKFAAKDEVNKLLSDHSNGFFQVYTQGAPLAIKHFQEFNEPIDMAGLVDYAIKNQMLTNLPRAWEDMTKPARDKKNAEAAAKADEARKAEIEAIKVAEFERGKREAAAAASPTDQRGIPPGMLIAPHRVAAQPKKDPLVPEGTKLGEGTAAMAATEAYLKAESGGGA